MAKSKSLTDAVQDERAKLLNVLGTLQCMEAGVKYSNPSELVGAIMLLQDEVQRIVTGLDETVIEPGLRALHAPAPGEEQPVISADDATPTLPAVGNGHVFDALYDRMQEELCAMRCALSAVEGSDWQPDEEVSAAVVLLRRTYAAMDVVHNDLSRWYMASRSKQS